MGVGAGEQWASGRAGGRAVSGLASEQWAASFHSRCRTSGAAPRAPLPSPPLRCAALPCSSFGARLPAAIACLAGVGFTRSRPARSSRAAAAAAAAPHDPPHPTPARSLAGWLAGSSLRSCTHRHANHLLHPPAQPLLLLMSANPAPVTQVGK